MIIFSNIGGAVTPIGDPPNVIIASNSDVIDAVSYIPGVLLLGSYMFLFWISKGSDVWSLHHAHGNWGLASSCGCPCTPSLDVHEHEGTSTRICWQWRYLVTKTVTTNSYNSLKDLRRRILVWRRTAESLSSYSKDEEAVKMSVTKKTLKLVGKLRHCNLRQSAGDHVVFGRYEETLKHLEQMV